jgi:hypothetical protein
MLVLFLRVFGFVSRVCLGLCLVDGAGRVLGRRVDRVEPKVRGAGVHEVVARSGRHVDQPIDGDRARDAVQDRLSFALDEDEHLVDIIVDLITTTWLFGPVARTSRK